MECEYCKRYLFQGGKCFAHKRNCILFEREPRGRVKRTTIIIPFDFDHVYETIKTRSNITITEGSKEVEVMVVKILEIDINEGKIRMEVDYHEKDWTPKSERLKKFKVLGN